jgi:hypothetical protein
VRAARESPSRSGHLLLSQSEILQSEFALRLQARSGGCE